MSASTAIQTPKPWLELPGGFPPDTVGFALRTTLALLLAYYVAFSMQLASASTAGICVAIVAQPQRGATLSKALYRFAGTLIGGTAAVVAVAAFGQDRTMLLTVFTLWLAACSFTASLLKDFRAYGAALAGYTLAIVAISDIDMPQAAFLTALDRVAAILLGVVSVGFVNGTFGRPDAWQALTGQLQRIIAETTDQAVGAIRGDPAPLTGVTGAERATAILALRTQADYVATELQDGRMRAAGARSAIAALLGMISASRAIDSGLARGEPDQRVRAALDRTVEALRRPDDLIAPSCLADAARHGAPELSEAFLLDRMDDLLTQHALALDGLAALATGRRPARQVRLRTYHDVTGALLNATRTAIVTALAALCCIYSGWSGSTFTLLEISAVVALLGMQPDPTRAAITFGSSVPVPIVAAGLVKFLLLPQVGGFVPFALAVAPFALVACALARHPRTSAGSGTGMLIFYTLILMPSNPQTYDLASFLNTAMALAVAILATLVGFSLVLPVSPSRRLFRVARAVMRDLRRTLRSGRSLEPSAVLSLQYDRLTAALVWLGRRTPARLAVLTQIRDLGALDVALCRAHAGLEAAVRQDPALAGAVAQARASLLRPAEGEMAAAATALLTAAQTPGPAPLAVLRAASGLYAASLLLEQQRRLLRLAGVLGRP